MALTPLDIHNKEFNVRFRGYDQDQVNDFLDQIIKDYETLIKHNEDLQRALKDSQEKVAYFTDLKDALNQSIIVAQDAADKVKMNAQRESEIIQDDAEKQARQLLNESTDKSNQILQDASEKARQITIETDDLKKQTRIFRQRLQVMLESQLEIVKSPEWNELLNDDQIESSNPLNQQLNYSNNTDYTQQQDSRHFNQGQAGYQDQSAADYNYNDASSQQYTTFDQSQNTAAVNGSAGTGGQVAPDSNYQPAASDMAGTQPQNNGGRADFSNGPDYQFDTFEDTQPQNQATQDPAPQGSVTPSAVPGQADAMTGDPSSNQQANMDTDYFNHNPEQNRPTIIFPDDATSGTMNNNKPKGN